MNQYYNQQKQPKNKVLAGLLGIFFGFLGIHNFYLGYIGRGLTQLLISVLSIGTLAPLVSIWGLIEGILILSAKPGSGWDTDSSGVELV